MSYASELGRASAAVTLIKMGAVPGQQSTMTAPVGPMVLPSPPKDPNRRVYPAEIAKALDEERWRIEKQTGQSGTPFQMEDPKLRLTPNQRLLLQLTGHGQTWPDKPWQPWEGAKIYKGDYEYSPRYPPNQTERYWEADRIRRR
jgi:hypothetical protein